MAFVGIERGNRFVRRFKLYLRDGTIMSIPYATLPLLTYAPAGLLTIAANEVQITIHGRNLAKLTDWFSEEKVLWIKESHSGVDDDREDIFIAKIDVKESDDP
jgi:hypothetical protein